MNSLACRGYDRNGVHEGNCHARPGTFKAGDKVTCNGGYPGVVIRRYSPGMIEVRLERGVVCIPDCDAKLVNDDKCKAEQSQQVTK